MERPSQPTLLGLPMECLNRILELVTHHEETGGIICPRPDYIYDGFYLLVSDHRFSMRGECEPDFPRLPISSPPFSPAALAKWENRKRIWNESPNKASGHTCTLDCLVQPSIASVNRRLRELSLPMFYGLNQFHFELGNFELSKGEHARDVKRCPADWWRAVGDANLSKLRQFNIIGKATLSEQRYGGTIIKYHADRGVQGKRVDGKRSREPNEAEEEEEKLQGLVDLLDGASLSVKAIEGVVAGLETRSTKYLRDHLSEGSSGS